MSPQYKTVGGYINTDPYYVSPEEETSMQEGQALDAAEQFLKSAIDERLAAARRDALEEAAKVAESDSDHVVTASCYQTMLGVRQNIAARIRALKPPAAP